MDVNGVTTPNTLRTLSKKKKGTKRHKKATKTIKPKFDFHRMFFAAVGNDSKKL